MRSPPVEPRPQRRRCVFQAMPLAGQDAPATGVIALTSVLSVALSTVGLALLRGTRPSSSMALGPGSAAWYRNRALGVCGAFLFFFGLVLASLPKLRGVKTDTEEKGAALIQCTLVLTCWITERYQIVGRPLPPVQSLTCAVMWFAATLVQWAGPKPFDNLSLGLDGQVSGCDGGYRTPFLIYAASWTTCLTAGPAFLLIQGCKRITWPDPDADQPNSSFADNDPSDPYLYLPYDKTKDPFRMRRLIVAVLFGGAIAMSELTFATGASTNEMGYIVLGAGALVLAVLLAWDFLWLIEGPLGGWAPLSLGAVTMLRLTQEHLVFRDFRWDPDSEFGPLTVWRWPGLHLFMFGTLILVFMLVLFIGIIDTLGWEGISYAEYVDLVWPKEPVSWPRKTVTLLQWILLFLCMATLFYGITMPLIDFEITLPNVQYVMTETAGDAGSNDTAASAHRVIHASQSNVNLISFLYDRRLPCNALVLALNNVILPPLQFLGTVFLLIRPRIIPADVLSAIRLILLDQAPPRFSNSFTVVTLVAFLNFSVGWSEDGWFKVSFASGFYSFLLYCFISVVLAQTLQEPAEAVVTRKKRERVITEMLVAGNSMPLDSFEPEGTGVELGLLSRRGRRLAQDSRDEEDSDNSDDSEVSPRKAKRSARSARSDVSDSGSGSDLEESVSADQGDTSCVVAVLLVVGILAMLVGGAYGIQAALEWPFLTMQYRISGLIVMTFEPNLLDLYDVLTKSDSMIALMAIVTIFIVVIIFIVVFFLRILAASIDSLRPARKVINFVEAMIRPWVMGHLWAMTFLALWYICTSRNKAVVEICASFPQPAYGVFGLVLLYGGSIGIQKVAEAYANASAPRAEPPPDVGASERAVKSTIITCAVVTWVGMVVYLYGHGPVMDREILDAGDMNRTLSGTVPVMNQLMVKYLPHSIGYCEALYNQGVAAGTIPYSTSAEEWARDTFCSGDKAIKNVTRMVGLDHNQEMHIVIPWATGIHTVSLSEISITPPPVRSTTAREDENVTQLWSVRVAGQYARLRIWVTVDTPGQNGFIDDYMCCHGTGGEDSPFQFAFRFSMSCTEFAGFQPVEMILEHLDPINIDHSRSWGGLQGNMMGYSVDYGQYSALQDTVQNVLSGQAGSFLLTNSDGRQFELMSALSQSLEHMSVLNGGSRCLSLPASES